jgi:hypothetical protein
MKSSALPSNRALVERAEPTPRYVVKKESGSEWARVMDTQTGMQIAKYSVLPRKRSTRDGWKDAESHAARLNTKTRP